MIHALTKICGVACCLFLVGLLGAQENGRAGAPQAAKGQAMGSFPCAWWLPINGLDHNTDVAATVSGLQSAGFKCGAFVVQGTAPAKSFDSFLRILEVTKNTDIAMWVIIVPPAEKGADTLPYRTDYVAWSDALSKISLKYKNFRGFNIDDYLNPGINTNTFTRDYGCKIYAAKQKNNPHFLFMPTLYDLDRTIADRLAGCVDGVWLWWTNLEEAIGLQSLLENSPYAARGRFPLYAGVYAHWTSWHDEAKGSPSPLVLRLTLESACKYADGVILWQPSLDPADPLLYVAKQFLPGGTSAYAGKCGTVEH
ncbi:MAG: hypothetical protein V4555_01695 [Acidobacteriota bacterium]